MAHLTNFSFEFFYNIFTEDASLPLLYHGAKKSKMTKNSNQGGGGPGSSERVKNASFAQRSAHRDSRIWRPELIEPAEERKRRARARGRRPTFKSAYSDPQILP